MKRRMRKHTVTFCAGQCAFSFYVSSVLVAYEEPSGFSWPDDVSILAKRQFMQTHPRVPGGLRTANTGEKSCRFRRKGQSAVAHNRIIDRPGASAAVQE